MNTQSPADNARGNLWRTDEDSSQPVGVFCDKEQCNHSVWSYVPVARVHGVGWCCAAASAQWRESSLGVPPCNPPRGLV